MTNVTTVAYISCAHIISMNDQQSDIKKDMENMTYSLARELKIF